MDRYIRLSWHEWRIFRLFSVLINRSYESGPFVWPLHRVKPMAVQTMTWFEDHTIGRTHAVMRIQSHPWTSVWAILPMARRDLVSVLGPKILIFFQNFILVTCENENQQWFQTVSRYSREDKKSKTFCWKSVSHALPNFTIILETTTVFFREAHREL